MSTTVIVGILTAIAGSIATITAQWLKGRQEAAVKEADQQYTGQHQFIQQLIDAAGKVPELLRDVERLMNENATLNGQRIVSEAKFTALEQRVQHLESEKAGLLDRINSFLSLEEENMRLKTEVSRLELRITELERSISYAQP